MTGQLSAKNKTFLIATTVLPPAGIAVAVVLLWNSAVSWRDLGILALFYVATGLGLSVGFHRLLTHRSFQTHAPIRVGLALLGTMAAHGPPLIWVVHHRRHHQFADHDGDPHSPHAHDGEGPIATLRALWHAHSSWRFKPDAGANPVRYAPDLLRDPGVMWVSRHFIAITVAGLLLPALLGFALTGTLAGAATGLVWGGLVRTFLGHHLVYSVNSLGHFAGPRRFDTPDESRNLGLLALPTFGDSWHNNHHAFPTSARHGLARGELDPSGALIAVMERLGLAWNVVRVSPERLRTKAIEEVAHH